MEYVLNVGDTINGNTFAASYVCICFWLYKRFYL